MRKSIKRQIIAVFLGLVGLCVGLIVFINYGFMEKFYLSNKEETLKTAYDTVVNANSSLDDAELSRFCSTNNVSVVLLDESTSTLSYSNLRKEDASRLQARLFGYVMGLEPEGDQIIEKCDAYTILRNRDKVVQMDFIEMWGKTDNNLAFIFRSPIESIQESMSLSNRFYLMAGLGIVVVGISFISFFANQITKPITELTDISQRMANLDFDVKYTSGGENEIGILGHNFNKMSETLEEAISELKTANNELQKDIEKKEQIDEMRKEFLSNVSHELKTPIALIQGYAEGLQDNINEDEESREFYCNVIIDEANKMNQLVKKLLTLNQLEFGNDQVNMERFDLIALIQGVLQSSALLIEQSEAEVIFRQTAPIYVWGDEFKVEEVITNYLTNAIHHVKNEKKIDIRCIQDGNIVKTIVFNTGDMIPEDELDKLWIKFYKVDKARTREYGGSGIGLSIVKAVLEAMNQKCGVKNFNNGVAFWFTLDASNDKNIAGGINTWQH
jgi:two-component system sensor histidine kinase VanS